MRRLESSTGDREVRPSEEPNASPPIPLEANAVLQAILEHAPDAVCLYSGDGKLLFASATIETLTGYSRDELIGRSLIGSPLLSIEGTRRVAAQLERIQEGKFTDTDEFLMNRKDKTQVPVEIRIKPITIAKQPVILVIARDVTTLRASEFPYAALINSTTDGFTILQDGMVRFVNQASLNLLGYSPKELVGTPFIRYISEQSRDAVLRRFQDRVAGKDVLGFYELDLLRRDGSCLPVEVNASRITYQDGVAVLALLRDISKRRHAEESLRRSEERYRKLVEQSLMGIVISRGNEVLFANPALLRIFGYETLEQSAGTSLMDHVAPSSHRLVEDLMKRIQANESPEYDFECDVVCADGAVRTLHGSSSRLVLDSGSYTQTMFEDITERKHAEEELRTSEAQLSNALRMAHAGHWEYDVASDTFTFNDTFYDIFRTSVDRVGGYTMSSAEYARRFCHPEDRHMVGAEVQAAITTGDPYYSRELEHRILYDDGTMGYMAVRFFVVKDSQEKTVRTYGVNQDITERRLSEQRIRKALEGTIQAIAETIETRDPYTAGHQKRVAKLAVAIAEHMQLPDRQVDGIRVAATLHDIGKISAPAEILSKPGKLSRQEFRLIQEHPRVAHDILKRIAFPWPIAEIILQHHERLDGSGYPGGLAGEDLLVEARILAVADTVEAMASHRPYRPALGIEEALQEILQNTGTLYDPNVVEACVALFHEDGFVLDESL